MAAMRHDFSMGQHDTVKLAQMQDERIKFLEDSLLETNRQLSEVARVCEEMALILKYLNDRVAALET